MGCLISFCWKLSLLLESELRGTLYIIFDNPACVAPLALLEAMMIIIRLYERYRWPYSTGAVVITFFICWAPFHAQRLLYVYQVSAFDDINNWLYPLGGCLYYFSTTVNPILYNVMSAKYRMAFKKTLYCSPTSPTITRDDLSSMKDSTVCGCGSRRGSQMVRVRSIHYQRSIK